MACSKYIEDLSALEDGELTSDEQSALHQHLSACFPCSQAKEQMQRLGGLLRTNNQFVTKNSAPDLAGALIGKLASVCQCVQEDLSAYLDGELIASAKEGVTEHLSLCSVCLSKFNDLTRINNLLSSGLKLPESINTDIWSSLKSRLNDDCLLIRSELSAFIDREVATLRHRAITIHLTECSDCSREFSELSQTGDLLRDVYKPDLAEDFDLTQGLRERLKVVPFQPSERRRAPLTVRRMYAAAAVAAVGIMVSLGFLWFGHSSAHAVQPVTAEAYLIDQSLGDPADVAEAVVYDHTP
jgi:anti-sigma factor RsiW